MTDRINLKVPSDQRFSNSDSVPTTNKFFLDAYDQPEGRKQTKGAGGLPANTDFRNGIQSDATPSTPKPAEIIKRAEPRSDGNANLEVRPRPGESIQRALDRAPSGATVIVPPGIYREKLNITRDNITLKADGKAVFDMLGQSLSDPVINISDRHNVTIDGFEIRNVRGTDTPTAIKVSGSASNIKILNNDIHHVENSANAHAISVFGTRATALKNITIAGNKLHDLKLGRSEALVLNGNVDGFKITDNAIADCDNIGIDIIGGEGVGRAGIDRARNGLIARNNIRNIDSRSNPAYRTSSAAGIYVDGGRDVVIENNSVFNSNYGIELASERRGWNTEGITVRRNRLEQNHLAGISLGGGSAGNGGVTDSIIEDNELRGNARPIWRQSNVGSSVIIRNNRER